MTPHYLLTHKIVELVAAISQLLGKIQANGQATPEPKLRKANKIKTIKSTLAIEGNALTIEQITAILDGKRVLEKASEILEVQNAVKLYDSLDHFNCFALKDFLNAHKILMNSLVKTAGRLRDQNVSVLKGGKLRHLAPQPRRVPELMTKLFSWLKNEKEVHLLIRSSIVHYEIEFIHPFEDGNGRMGRFWQFLMLYKLDPIFKFIPIESLVEKNQQSYYSVLEKCDKKGDSTFFIEFMLGLIFTALSEFNSELKGITLNSQDRLEKAREAFQNQFFSRSDYMIFFKNISSATASRDLKFGTKENLLHLKGESNQTKYKFTKAAPRSVI